MNIHNEIDCISRKSLHEELVDRLRDLIIEGELKAGEKFPEKDLCLKFGVSRTPMREALKVLASEGLIVLERNRGAWVSPITVEELSEIFPVLAALEALAGELACAMISDDEIQKIVELNDQMVSYYTKRDLPGYFRCNQNIHAAILDGAQNATLTTQHRSLAVRIRRARFVANIDEARWQEAVAEHQEICKALVMRDGPLLADVLKRHLGNKFKSLCKRMAEVELQNQSLAS